MSEIIVHDGKYYERNINKDWLTEKHYVILRNCEMVVIKADEGWKTTGEILNKFTGYSLAMSQDIRALYGNPAFTIESYKDIKGHSVDIKKHPEKSIIVSGNHDLVFSSLSEINEFSRLLKNSLKYSKKLVKL